MVKSSLYRQEILEHARNPRNFGKMLRADVSAHEANLSCGDEITLYLKFSKKSGGAIAAVSFEGRGCILCLAGASMLTGLISAKKVVRLKKLKESDVLKLFGPELTPSRQKCALISYGALKKALE